MGQRELPSFDLIVATVDRVAELDRLLASLECQSEQPLRILLVDQNADDRLEETVQAHGSLAIVHLKAARGLSRARNVALAHASGDLVAFPDDDCIYPDRLLSRVAARFDADPTLDGLTGRAADEGGNSAPSWPLDGAELNRENVWNRAISFTIFLRREVVERVGAFDERLGLPESSGEEIDYLVRALDAGARLEYDPSLVVFHSEETRDLRGIGARDGMSIGYLLRKHRYPPRTVARMLARPAGGTLIAAARGDRARASFHLATLRGRIRGYRDRPASAPKSSA